MVSSCLYNFRGEVSDARPLAAVAPSIVLQRCRPRPSTSWLLTWTAQAFDLYGHLAIRPRRPRFSHMRMCAHAGRRVCRCGGAHTRTHGHNVDVLDGLRK